MEKIAVVWESPNIHPGYNFTVNVTTGLYDNGKIAGMSNYRAKTREGAEDLANAINAFWIKNNKFPPAGMFPQFVD
jgi:hypothetical protein